MSKIPIQVLWDLKTVEKNTPLFNDIVLLNKDIIHIQSAGFIEAKNKKEW